MSSFQAVASLAKGEFGILERTFEDLHEGEVRIKVQYAAMIAFDTYVNDLAYYIEKFPVVMAFSAAGIISEVGTGVPDLKIGDRVTAFTFKDPVKSKGLQEYTIQHYTACAKVPHSIPLDGAAAMPDNFVTAYFTLFNRLGLPNPDFPTITPPALASTPILIYGAGSTAGQYAIQLLRAAGYTNVIATASTKHHSYLRNIGARHTFDYKSPTMVEDVTKAAGGPVKLVIDCITATGTIEVISKLVDNTSKVALLLPIKYGNTVRAGDNEMTFELPDEKNPLPKETIVPVRTFLYQSDEFLKYNLMPKILPQLLELGLVSPTPIRLLKEGTLLERASQGLDLLRNNKVSGEKVVVQIGTGA